MKKIVTLVIFGWSTMLFAADPGGLPGLVKAKFIGSAFDTTSDVFANALGYVWYPEEMYASSCPEKTTYAWAGYMKMVAGVKYNFKGYYDDYTAVKVAGSWIFSGNGQRTGSYTPSATDWYPVEFRIANNTGPGGCTSDSIYGILWNTDSDQAWRMIQEFTGGSLLKTGRTGLTMAISKTAPAVISSCMRKNDPTVMDVEYIVLSPHDTVNVRALAFEDGERSFWKVVRATTFTKDPDGNDTACNIGDNIAANVSHKLAWKVAADWNTDLAKVKFEVICSDAAQLPLKLQTIPATAKNPAMTIGYGTQTDADIFNALLWYYAKGDEHLINTDGYVDVTGIELINNQTRWVNRTSIAGERMDILKWLYAKMGYEPLVGGNLMNYVRKATRKDLWFNSGTQTCVIKTGTKPSNLYLGERAYCVIDVSGGQDAESYPVSYLDTEPVDGWGDEYKTTKILLRRCEAGQYMFRNSKPVTLTKSFYIGVFPVTQRQHVLVTGSNPTIESRQGEMYPVNVSWNGVRGYSSVGANTFLGRLQARTGVEFDLPTDAQWEYACRAGTSSSFANGGGNWSDWYLMASGNGNPGDVGLYQPNLWGVYDMHGSVGEWCLDYSGNINDDPAIDYSGPTTGSYRVYRGWYSWSQMNTSYVRNSYFPSASSWSGNYFGVRICGIIAE